MNMNLKQILCDAILDKLKVEAEKAIDRSVEKIRNDLLLKVPEIIRGFELSEYITINEEATELRMRFTQKATK